MPGTFRALRHRGYRELWIGLFVSAIGTWMQIVAQSLLVLHLTNGSPFWLGLVSLAQALSFLLFALVGGSIADRFDKRRVLLLTQTILGALAALLALLVWTGVVRAWMIVALAFVSGTVLSFDQPTRGALLPELVPGEDLQNAISLQSIVFNGAAAIGPAVAGLVIARVGIAGDFLLNAASYVAVLVALARLPATKREEETRRGPLLVAVRAALSTVARDPILPWILSAYGAMLFLGPSPALLLPVFGTKILALDPTRLGLLFSAAGVGTIAGALGLASARELAHKGRALLVAVLAWGSALGGLSRATSFAPAFAALVVLGCAQILVGALAVTLLQTRVPPAMRGRVMSLNTMLIMGVRPLGDFAAGALIGAFGAPFTAAVTAAIVGGYGALLLVAGRGTERAATAPRISSS